MIKSVLLTSKYYNKTKGEEVFAVLKRTTEIKNKLSECIYANRHLLFVSDGIKKLNTLYSSVNLHNDETAENPTKDPLILSWNIQKEHQMLVDKYKNALNKRLQNLKVRLQSEMIIERYKKDTKYAKKGDTKRFEIKFKSTKLTKFVKYLVYLELDKDILPQLKNEGITALYEYYKTKPYFARIVNLAKNIQTRILNKLKLIKFTETSSLLLDHTVNKARIDYDNENTLYKYWFVFRMKNGKEFRLPLQINGDYHNGTKKPTAKEFVIYPSAKGNKINIATVYEAEKPIFKPYSKPIGMDLNLKNNFATLSDGYTVDYDRNYMKRIVSNLKELDQIGYQNLTAKQLKKLKKIYRQLDWYVSYLIYSLLNYLEKNNITDLVIENLLLSGKFGINEEFDIKYSRLSKLLHLSDVKNKLITQAEKRGIRVHITPSHYTSQTCPVCGHISRSNRKTQEDFECENCGHKANADLNASKNILLRFVSDVLKTNLHNTDDYGRLTPKKLNNYTIKNILNRYLCRHQAVLHHPVCA
ncbi:MAG: RNA-guided endonuclease InsQ/TnpB family protein [Desulfurella sp.]|uniref:RNA-guided endonuclease InsQ/TnpB family protein n=1 Tax=Desulfurella sp. TaxID=1962857 RepID=UPI003D1513D9